MKPCSKCNEHKTLESFPKDNRYSDGRRPRCKSCIARYLVEYRQRDPGKIKDYFLKRDFGISIDQYNQMLASQGGLCAVCKKPEYYKHQSGKTKSLSVDHCHTTGKVRGLLCGDCNRAIGLLNDSIDLLLDAATYIQRNKAV